MQKRESAITYAYGVVATLVQDDALRSGLLRVLCRKYSLAHAKPTLREIAAYLDEVANAIIEVAYVLRVEDHPRVQERVELLLDLHSGVRQQLEQPPRKGVQ